MALEGGLVVEVSERLVGRLRARTYLVTSSIPSDHSPIISSLVAGMIILPTFLAQGVCKITFELAGRTTSSLVFGNDPPQVVGSCQSSRPDCSCGQLVRRNAAANGYGGTGSVILAELVSDVMYGPDG